MSEWSHKYVVYDAFAPGMVSWGKLLVRGSAKFNSKDTYKEHHYTLDRGRGSSASAWNIFLNNEFGHIIPVMCKVILMKQYVCVCEWRNMYVHTK